MDQLSWFFLIMSIIVTLIVAPIVYSDYRRRRQVVKPAH